MEDINKKSFMMNKDTTFRLIEKYNDYYSIAYKEISSDK